MKKNIIIFSLLILIVIESVLFSNLLKRMQSITVISTMQDSLYVSTPLVTEKNSILLSVDFTENFSHYQSPFGDSLSFQDLINKYVHNRYTDHYGAKRGTRKNRRIHEGIDLYVPEDTPLYPLAGYGIVTEASDDPHYLVTVEVSHPDGTKDSTKIEYGKTVRILYPEGIESIYTHLNEVNVEIGQEVGFHTIVGKTGLTGNIRNSGKPSHLHLELRDYNGESFDPRHRLHFTQYSIRHFLEYLKLNE